MLFHNLHLDRGSPGWWVSLLLGAPWSWEVEERIITNEASYQPVPEQTNFSGKRLIVAVMAWELQLLCNAASVGS